MAARNHVVDAAAAFREIALHWPGDELADDALWNVGACYLAMSQQQRAVAAFREVIERYPDADIHPSDERGESGRTAAKAWLGIVTARLGLGDIEGARQACDELANYPDSKVEPPHGEARSFHDIGRAIIAAALHPDHVADHISPDDIAAG